MSKQTIQVTQYMLITQEEFNKLQTRELIKMKCSVCNNDYEKSKKNILKRAKDSENSNLYCSSKCSNAYKLEKYNTVVDCINCNVEFLKSNVEIEKTNNHFCSRSCSAKYNNKLIPKRKLITSCSKCTNIVRNYRSTLCETHFKELNENRYSLKTLEECQNSNIFHPSWLNSKIRGYNRSSNKDLIKLPCAKCKYTRHVELCHIKAITNFSKDALISEINSITNVIQLCPTCHWEFDNGFRTEFKELLTSLNKVYSEC